MYMHAYNVQGVIKRYTHTHTHIIVMKAVFIKIHVIFNVTESTETI